jgi:signal transduction histidine kinase/CheY-like chemotaxis protein
MVAGRLILSTRVLAAYAVVGGTVAALAWPLDVPRLADWTGSGVAVQPNTALSAALLGASLLALSWNRRRVAACLALPPLIFAFVTLVEHCTGYGPPIHHWLLFGRTWGTSATVSPGRMGPPASLAWTLIGTGVMLLCTGRSRRRSTAMSLALGTLVIGMIALTGYMYGAHELTLVARITAISVPTMTFVFAISIALLLLVPEVGPIRLLRDRGPAGILMRNALPALVLFPLLLGYLRIQGERAGLYDLPLGTAGLVIILTILLVAVLFNVARQLSAAQSARLEAEAGRARAEVDRDLAAENVQLALRAAGQGAWSCDLGTGEFWCDAAAARMNGYSPDAPPRTVSEAGKTIHPADAERVPQLLRDAIRTGELFESVHRVIVRSAETGADEVRWLISIARADGPNGRLHGVCRDVTAHKHVEAEARAFDLKLRAFASATSDVLYRMSADWTEMQPLDGRTLVESSDAPIRGWLQKNIPESEHAIIREAIAKSIATRSMFELEHRVHRPDHSIGWTYSRAVPILDERGEIVEWFGVAADVTDRKRFEEALRDADRRKDEFLATLAHELRNPMAAIRGGVAVMRAGAARGKPVTSIVDTIDRQTRHMVRLIDDLMDVSRVSRGKIALQRERVDLVRIVEQAIEMARPGIEEHRHDLRMRLPKEPIVVLGDAARLTQIVGNLINNAAKFTDAGGTVFVSLSAHEDSAELRVRDTGIGIAREHLGRVFELFSQLDGSLSRPHAGLGIGLALVKNLVGMHGGTVEARSEGRGHGSEFVVRLPLAERSTEPPGAAGSPTNGAAGTHAPATAQTMTRRVLVVDDNRDAAEMLATLLRAEGHEVRESHDGHDALRVAAVFRPDVVLLDIGMPHLDGHEVARQLRAARLTPEPLLVALTGWGQDEDRRRSREAGFDAHLVKPIDANELTGFLSMRSRSDPESAQPVADC